jgi:hypothetical protein
MATSKNIIETRGCKRQELVIKKLLKIAGKQFKLIADKRTKADTPLDKRGRPKIISLSDCLMCGLAIFSLKYSSLLQFDDQARDSSPLATVPHNLSTLYKVECVPCDTYMRECLDLVEPSDLRPIFKDIFSSLQRDKILENYVYLDEGYILSLDGTGYFSSNEVHCENCCEKHYSNGKVTYYHQMLAGSIVHPERRQVIPLFPEPIHKVDGQEKNDCERVAAKRFIEGFRKEHPFLPVVVVEDALASNGPHIKELEKNKMHYIFVVKPDGNKFLFEWLQGVNFNEVTIKKKDTVHQFRFYNGAPLNDANSDIKVNFFEYWEINENKKTKHWTWITDITITKDNVYQLMRAGRARWKIENETFNTLKNQGYHFEHNFGHGYVNLTDVLAVLMMLAFLIDQAQAICCRLFQTAKERLISWLSFWERFRSTFFEFLILSWEDYYQVLAYGHERTILCPNTS